jgi:RNA polymerase sigma factor (sigma-70 family)
MVQFSDEQIIKGIAESDKSVLNWLYQNQFGKIRKYITHRGGDIGIVKDIFQEALLIIYTKIRNEDLHLTCSFSTYFFAICRNLWFHELRIRRKISAGGGQSENMVEDSEPDSDIVPELKKLVEYHFSQLSEDCKKVLEMHFNHCSLAEICEIMGYKDVKYASDRKYRCKQYLFKKITNDPKYKKITDGLY